MTARLTVSRAQIVAYRRAANHLDDRLPPGADSLRRAAWAGLSDSMPRAAVLSLHARVEGVGPDAWEAPSLAQVWGPRFSAYVVAEVDVPVFTIGRMPPDGRRLKLGRETADKLEAFLAGRTMTYSEAGHGLGLDPNALRYAAPTGRVRIRWDGARRPTIWTVPAPDVEAREMRLELARRHLHVLGPTTAQAFGDWAGVKTAQAEKTFEALAGGGELVAVRTPIGEGWILAADEPALRSADPAAAAVAPAPARLLPSGDAFYLLQGPERELLVPDPGHRARLWTSRVWPGALLLDGEVAGTWRRSDLTVTVEPWRAVTAAERQAVEAEAASLPLPGDTARIEVRWAT